MNLVDKNIERIAELLESEDKNAMAYAALEARAAIETICYDRMRLAYKYASYSDLRDWRPSRVMKFLEEEVDEHLWRGMTLSISKEPVDPEQDIQLADLEYFEVGRQVNVSISAYTKSWYKLSSYLHVALPKDDADFIAFLPEPEKARDAVEEAMELLKEFSKGSLVSIGSLFGSVTFDCPSCNFSNRRTEKSLFEGKVVGCVGKDCDERFLVTKEDGDFYFTRCTVDVTCGACETKHVFPQHLFSKNPSLQSSYKFCCHDCGAENEVRWLLGRRQVN